MVRYIRAVHLKRGDVLALPFNKTATVADDPRIGRQFVSFKTEHGPTRVGIDEDILVEYPEKGTGDE